MRLFRRFRVVAPAVVVALAAGCFWSDAREPDGAAGRSTAGSASAGAGASTGASTGTVAVAGTGASASVTAAGVTGTALVRGAPKPLSPAVERGLAWLLSRQHEDGGFAQGEETATMGNGMDGVRDRANVADTCMAALALIRAGSTPSEGRHAKAIRGALGFVCAEVERAPEEGLSVTSVSGTRVQSKIGSNVDTFLAAMLLAETRGKMPDAAGNKRLMAALDKVMDKIEKNQRQDGTWDGHGWAPVISQGLASKAMNRAIVAGADVSEATLLRATRYSEQQVAAVTTASPASGAPAAGEPASAGPIVSGGRGYGASGAGGPGDAGVGLYSQGANMGALSDTAANAPALEGKLRLQLAAASTPEGRKEAEDGIRALSQIRAGQTAAMDTFVARLDDPGFVSGFGSNGGEEFLSYMNISETLAQKGGAEWERWDARMAENLARIQNDDGSFSGHHCITGRTFCTSAALLVLTADRAPYPVASRARGT